jgi:hypothetical protein
MMTEKQSTKSAGKGGKRPGAGRPKGSLDKGNAQIRELIVQALDEVGGAQYLADLAKSHPAAFCGLLGRVIPLQVTGEGGGAVQHAIRVTFG